MPTTDEQNASSDAAEAELRDDEEQPAAKEEETAAEPAPPPLETFELRVGRFQVPEDADDMLGLAHRLPGVVHVWLSGSTLCIECEPGTVDRELLVERLRDDGYPVRLA
jgi:hypothetical protein